MSPSIASIRRFYKNWLSSSMPLILLCLFTFGTSASLQAQCKLGKKRAKELKKDNWEACVTCPALADMFCEIFGMMQEVDEETGVEKYLSAEGTASAQSESAAKKQAIEIAKGEIAGQLTNEIQEVISTTIANNQISTTEAESLTKMVAKYQNVIVTSLPNVKPKFIVFRPRKNVVECRVRIFFDSQKAQAQALAGMQSKIKADLEAEANELFKRTFGNQN
ncbi:MAG: hypothetical protein AAFO96_16045 [Bacteroidota bacterium]